jgi:hypothetical protein
MARWTPAEIFTRSKPVDSDIILIKIVKHLVIIIIIIIIALKRLYYLSAHFCFD